MQLRESDQRVKVEGILSETDISYTSYVKDGKTVEAIKGVIKVLVRQVINDVEQALEIPVNLFSPKMTKKGTINPSYESIERVMKEFTSIAAAGSEGAADKVRITGAKLEVNEYYNSNNKLMAFPRVKGSFIGIATGEFKPEATFSSDFIVLAMAYETDKDGIEIEPQKLKVTVGVIQYGGSISVLELVATNPNVIAAVSDHWEVNGTFKASGRLNFTSKVETVLEEVDFGEPVERVRTITSSELIITGGSQTPLEGDFAFSVEDIAEALEKRKISLEEAKVKTTKSAPAPMGSTDKAISEAGKDLGF